MDDRRITNELQIVASLFKHYFKALCLNLRIVWSRNLPLEHDCYPDPCRDWSRRVVRVVKSQHKARHTHCT